MMLDKGKELLGSAQAMDLILETAPMNKNYICTRVHQHCWHCFSNLGGFNYFFPSEGFRMCMQINHIYIGNLDFKIFIILFWLFGL